jgi:hypothetical protein
LLRAAGFRDLAWVETLRWRPSEVRDVEPLGEASGRGAFLVVRAGKGL